MVPSWANQLPPQLLMEQFDTLPIQYRHIEHMHEGVWLTKLQLLELWQFFPYMAFVNAWIVPLWADQLLPELLMEQYDTLPIQCRHIEHMHEGVYNYFWSDSTEIFFSKPKFFHWLLLCGGYLISIAYWLFSLHMLLKDKCMCLQDEWKL